MFFVPKYHYGSTSSLSVFFGRNSLADDCRDCGFMAISYYFNIRLTKLSYLLVIIKGKIKHLTFRNHILYDQKFEYYLSFYKSTNCSLFVPKKECDIFSEYNRFINSPATHWGLKSFQHDKRLHSPWNWHCSWIQMKYICVYDKQLLNFMYTLKFRLIHPMICLFDITSVKLTSCQK